MKKTLITLTAVMVAAASFAQGTIQFQNSASGALTKVYMPDGQTSYQTVTTKIDGKTGNTATDSVAGSTTYTGALLQGAFTAQLWAAPGSGAAESLLVGATTTTFRTGAGAGRIGLVTATLANVLPDAAVATLQVRVFPTSYGSWANALAAFNSGVDGLAWIGKSAVFDVQLVGGTVNTPPVMTGLTSFSLATNVVPEPSSMALAGLGAASLLIFRRRK